MSELVVDIQDLHRFFGTKQVLRGINLQIHPGIVYGLVGENGTGKTTLIKHMLGRLFPQAGSVRMFGIDPIEDPAGVLGKIGYLSETRDMPQWMKVGEFIRYMQAFYPSWDEKFAAQLQDAFALASETHVSHLSRGQTARLGLLVAIAHRPPLLLLDEPSSGLDAVVRRDILAEVIRTVADEGRTVFFSSHLLDEVQRVSDYVGILRDGKIIMEGRVDDLLKSFKCYEVTFDEPLDAWPIADLAFCLRGGPKEWSVVSSQKLLDRLRPQLAELGGVITNEKPTSLEELFVVLSAGGAEQ
jgi:ABC-2 type transport system ATP-binding protein